MTTGVPSLLGWNRAPSAPGIGPKLDAKRSSESARGKVSAVGPADGAQLDLERRLGEF